MDERRLFSWLYYSAAVLSFFWFLMGKRRRWQEGRMEWTDDRGSFWINEGHLVTDGVTPVDGCFNYSPPLYILSGEEWKLAAARGRFRLGLQSFPSLTSRLPKSPICQKPFCVGAEVRADKCLPLRLSSPVTPDHKSCSPSHRPLRPSIPLGLPGGIIIISATARSLRLSVGRHFEGQKWGRR